MLKITDTNYRLPFINAESYIKELSQSANRPLLIRGHDMETFESSECILKLRAGERMSTGGCLRELLASFLALELGLNCPEPVIVNISKEFCDSMASNHNYLRLERSIGLNFGSKYLKDIVVWQHNPSLARQLHSELQKIFIFDMLIDNSDRSQIKPNLATNNNDVFIFDHEIAFAFCFIVGIKNDEVWKITEYESLAANNHVLYRTLKGKEFVNENFMDNLRLLGNNFWDKAEDLIPSEWMDSNFAKIKNHIQNKIDHLDEYKTNIQGLLL